MIINIEIRLSIRALNPLKRNPIQSNRKLAYSRSSRKNSQLLKTNLTTTFYTPNLASTSIFVKFGVTCSVVDFAEIGKSEYNRVSKEVRKIIILKVTDASTRPPVCINTARVEKPPERAKMPKTVHQHGHPCGSQRPVLIVLSTTLSPS